MIKEFRRAIVTPDLRSDPGLDRAALADLLPMLTDSEDWHEVGWSASLAVERILHRPWNPGRLARCVALLREKKKPPKISVVRYWLNTQAWYIVNDGNHRVEAARQAGQPRILARISSEAWCRPDRCVVDEKGWLWRQRADVRWGHYLMLVGALSEAQLDIARKLDIKSVRLGGGDDHNQLSGAIS